MGGKHGQHTREERRSQQRDAARHPLMTQFQDYDWADEVVHAHFGQQWGVDLYDGDKEAARRAAQQALDEFWAAVGEASKNRPAPLSVALREE